MKKKKRNPFYPLLILLGIVFVISASTYGVMAIRGTDRSEAISNETGLMGFMDQHGDWLLIIEVVLLGLLTVAAIGTDEIGGNTQMKKTNRVTNDRDLESSTTTPSHTGIDS